MGISLREKIYFKIRNDITFGNLMPGQRLVEANLAHQFNASRSPIREALRQLESEGFIQLERNKGITVSNLSIEQVSEIYDIRWLIESYATSISARKIDEKQLAYLRNLHNVLKKAAKESDYISWLKNNASFHNFFSDNCGNTNLIQILDILKRRVFRYHYIAVRSPMNFKDYLGHHEGILRACEKNDGGMAEKYMKEHLEYVKKVILEDLNFNIGMIEGI